MGKGALLRDHLFFWLVSQMEMSLSQATNLRSNKEMEGLQRNDWLQKHGCLCKN